MGYDMYWCQDARDEASYENALQAFYQAVNSRDAGECDQSVVEEAFERMSGAEPGYFRLNIWGMGVCRRLMGQFEMAYQSAPDSALSAACDKAREESLDNEVPDDLADSYLRSGATSVPGIAMHKLTSNDGWIVTPMECVGALSQWQKWCYDNGCDEDFIPSADVDGEEQKIEWWGEWLEYLRAAALHGGFRVY